MKKLIATLVFTGIIAGTAHADHRLSDLRIRNFDHRPVTVSLNHNQILQSGSSVTFRNLAPGRHYITVWGQDFRNNPSYTLYRGFIDIPVAAEVSAMVTRNRQIRINQVNALYTQIYEPLYQPLPAPVHCGTICPPGIDPVSFEALRQTISSSAFESTRIQIARQAIRQYGSISVMQVREILEQLSFESSRLEIARFAYPYTFDRDQYFRLYDAFSFESSVNELIRFMERHG